MSGTMTRLKDPRPSGSFQNSRYCFWKQSFQPPPTGTVTASRLSVTPPAASVMNRSVYHKSCRPVGLHARAHEPQEAPQLVKLERARQRHLKEIAEHGRDAEIDVLIEPEEPPVGGIVAEQRGQHQARRRLAGFSKWRQFRQLADPARQPAAARGPCCLAAPQLGVIRCTAARASMPAACT